MQNLKIRQFSVGNKKRSTPLWQYSVNIYDSGTHILRITSITARTCGYTSAVTLPYILRGAALKECGMVNRTSVNKIILTKSHGFVKKIASNAAERHLFLLAGILHFFNLFFDFVILHYRLGIFCD